MSIYWVSLWEECKPSDGACVALGASEKALDADGNAMPWPLALAVPKAPEALEGRKAVRALSNATKEIRETWDTKVAQEIPAPSLQAF